jgi:hypothetical protein
VILELMLTEKRKVTPQRAMEILKRSGLKVTEEEVEIILDFMYKLSKLTVDNYLKAGTNTAKIQK